MYPIPALLARETTKKHLKTLKTVLLSSLSVTGLPWSVSALGEIFLFCAEHDQVETANFLLNSLSSDDKRQSTIAYKRRSDLETSLHLAAGQNHLHFVRFLLDIIGPEHKMLIATNRSAENALQKSANVSALRITKLLLEKVKNDNPKFLDIMLRQKSDQKQTALRYAIKSSNHNSRKCAQMIISYYEKCAQMDISSTFLSYLEIGDITKAQELWEREEMDADRRKLLIEKEDAEGYNCFLIVSRNGDHRSLQWLLSLNDEKKDEAAEDERNVMTKHKKTGETPLLICVSHDIRKKVDGQKELTDEEKQSYFQCVSSIFETVSKQKMDFLLKERDQYAYDSIAWCCWNGNIETAKYLLSHCSASLRRDLMVHHDHGHEYFNDAIRGGNVQLIHLIHAEYEKAIQNSKEVLSLKKKEAALEAQKKLILQTQSAAEIQERGRERKAAEAVEKGHLLEKKVIAAKTTLSLKLEKNLLRGTKALSYAFYYGVMGVADWILNDLIDDSKKRMKFLNETITDCKKGRRTEGSAQEIINKILERDLEPITNQKGIDNVRNIFQFLMKHDDINGVSMILKKLKNNEKTKKMWFRTVQCLEYAADGRSKLLGELLKYLGQYYQPLLDQKVLIAAIEKHSVPVVSLLFDHVHDPKTKDHMIETRNIRKNALIWCVEQNDAKLMSIIVRHHTNIEPILGDSFRSCLKSGNVKSVGFLLDQTLNKSALFNEVDDYERTALMFSVRSGSAQCLRLIVEELQDEFQREQLETESTDEKRDEAIESDPDHSMAAVHPMYAMVDSKGDNILHYFLSDPNRSANDKQLGVLKNALSSDQFRWLLDQRNLSDESPLHRLNASTTISILEWILDLYDEPLERFKAIASSWERTKFAHSVYDPYSSAARIIREFFGEHLVDCLEAVDFDKVDTMLLRETFRFTLSWKRPAIQELILSKISDEKRPELLISENLHCKNPIIFDLIRVDDRKVAKVVLPEIIKMNPQMLLALNGQRQSALAFSMTSDRFNIMDLIFDSIENESYLRQYSLSDYEVFTQIYEFRKMTKLVQSKIPDQDLTVALEVAVQFDEDMEFTQSLLDRVSTEKEKNELLRSLTIWNQTLFSLGTRSKMRSIMEYLMNDVIKYDGIDNVFFFTEPDYQFRVPLIRMVDDILNFDIFERALMSLKPMMRLQQLLFEKRNGGCILTESKSRDFQKKLAKLAMAELRDMKGPISDLTQSLLRCDYHQGHCDDINTLLKLFNHGATISNMEYLQLILSKTPQELKYKLLVNYEGGWEYNRIKTVMEGSNQKKNQLMLDLLLDQIDNERVVDALRDVDNPEQYPITVLQLVCEKGDTKKFRAIQSIYEKANIPINDDLFAIDHQGGSLLHRAMAKVCDIPKYIFEAMKSDQMKIQMINQRQRSDGKCLFDIAQSSNKRLLKGVVSDILQNVEKTKMEYTEFIPYFHWLIKQKDLDSIRTSRLNLQVRVRSDR